jgi:hypothetical protein
MSFFEVLDRFLATGVLACAGLVGAELPESAPLDGLALSTRLRASNANETYGSALDTLAHVVWFARERHGIPHEAAERHAAELSRLLSEVRFAPGEIATAFAAARAAVDTAPSETATGPAAHLSALWLTKATASEALSRASLDNEICRFLLSEMLVLVVGRGTLLTSLAPILAEHRTAAAIARSAPPPDPIPSEAAVAPPPAGTEPPQPALSELAGSRASARPQPASFPPPAAVADVKARHHLPEAPLRRLQAVLAQQPMSSEQRLARLDELAAWLMATISFLKRPSNDSPEVRAAKLEAAAALEAGDLELAMERLKTVRDHMRESRRRAESRIAEELQALRQQMIEEARATARLGELALARMDLDAAADHFSDAAGQLPANEAALELEYRQRQAEALATKAEVSGEPRVLEAAAQAFRHCRRLIGADADPRTRMRINVGLGDMLMALGIRRPNDVTALEEAVAAFCDAVAATDRALKPMQWALVQLSHGAALIELGQRHDLDRHWHAAATVLMPALDVFESRGASDLAEAARAKLRKIAKALGDAPEQGKLPAPRNDAKSA